MNLEAAKIISDLHWDIKSIQNKIKQVYAQLSLLMPEKYPTDESSRIYIQTGKSINECCFEVSITIERQVSGNFFITNESVKQLLEKLYDESLEEEGRLLEKLRNIDAIIL